jgi:hypothetical protein
MNWLHHKEGWRRIYFLLGALVLLWYVLLCIDEIKVKLTTTETTRLYDREKLAETIENFGASGFRVCSISSTSFVEFSKIEERDLSPHWRDNAEPWCVILSATRRRSPGDIAGDLFGEMLDVLFSSSFLFLLVAASLPATIRWILIGFLDDANTK